MNLSVIHTRCSNRYISAPISFAVATQSTTFHGCLNKLGQLPKTFLVVFNFRRWKFHSSSWDIVCVRNYLNQLIHKTKSYKADLPPWTTRPRMYNLMETHLWSSPSVVIYFPGQFVDDLRIGGLLTIDRPYDFRRSGDFSKTTSDMAVKYVAKHRW